MDMQILKQRDYPLLKRKRVSSMVDFKGATPSVIQFRDSLASKLKVKKEVIAIRHVYQRFGKSTAKVIAHIYETEEAKNNLEKPKSAEKKEIEAAKKTAEEKKTSEAAKVEEKPKEEVKETPKEEVKEVPKETPKEQPKEEVKETPKEEMKDGKETSKE